MTPNNGYAPREVTYQHVVLEGSAYEVGRMQGDILKCSYKAGMFSPAFYGSADLQPALHGFNHFDEMQALVERYCPGLNDEIQGFADSLGVPVEKIMNYQAAYSTVAGCSHMAVLPAISADGHVYMGRSYELNPDDEDLRLCTTRVRGKAAHVGFSTLLLGRLDGLNEHGLAVTMSAGSAAGQREKGKGFDFWIALRAILDQCETVGAAVEWLRAMPLMSYTNFLLADKSGHAALVETAGSRIDVKQIDAHTPEQFLISTNHYTLPATRAGNTNQHMLENSTQRCNTVMAWLDAHAPHIDKAVLQGILSKEYPDGCCCPYYAHGLGTLWSLVFDVTAGVADICFGAPTHNAWHRFTPCEGAMGMHAYCALLP